MSYPHRIRLRGPWEAEPIDPPGESRRVTLPARLDEVGFGGCRRIRFRRRFGRPRQIDAHERLWLIGESFSGRGSFRLNEHDLGPVNGTTGPFAFAVTDRIAERNELSVDFTAETAEDGLTGDIALEIRCAAYLAGLRMLPAGDRFRVIGSIAGDWVDRLEVYVLADGRSVGYQVCGVGEEFDILIGRLTETPDEIRIELVNGAIIWYAADLPTEARQA